MARTKNTVEVRASNNVVRCVQAIKYVNQQIEDNEIQGEMSDLDQTSSNIVKHNVWCPKKVRKQPKISPEMISNQMIGQKLVRLHTI